MRPKDAVDPLKQDGVVYKTVTIEFSTECLKQRDVSIGQKNFFTLAGTNSLKLAFNELLANMSKTTSSPSSQAIE